MKKMLLLALAVICASCAHQQENYYWGNYESLLYESYAKPGEATPSIQIHKLTDDIRKAAERGKAVPPGVHAHLGMMYAAAGNLEQALAAFTQEKKLYPEATSFIDDMIARATGVAKAEGGTSK